MWVNSTIFYTTFQRAITSLHIRNYYLTDHPSSLLTQCVWASPSTKGLPHFTVLHRFGVFFNKLKVCGNPVLLDDG